MTVGKVQNKPQATNTPRQNTGQTRKSIVNIPPSPSGKNRGAGMGLKSFSLKNLAQKAQQPAGGQQKTAEKQVIEEPVDSSWNETFSREKLDETWRCFTRLYEASPRIHAIFKNHRPTQIDDAVLLIKLRNKTQEHELVKERPNILSYLKRNLRNATIQLNFEIAVDDADVPKKAFTVAEKYNEMSNKNPALALFKKAFNLNLE